MTRTSTRNPNEYSAQSHSWSAISRRDVRCSSGLRRSRLCDACRGFMPAMRDACASPLSLSLSCSADQRLALMAPCKTRTDAGVCAPRHLPPLSAGAGPRCPLTTAHATRLAILVTPHAGRVVSPTTPRCVLGRSSSPITQGSRSAAPRLTRLTPARASRLTPVTPRSPPARAIAPHHHTNHHTQPIHEPDTKLMAPLSHSHSPRCRPCPEAAMMVRPANVRMHRACSFWFKTLTLILTSSPAPAAASVLSSRALPDRAPHRSDFVRCAPPVPALSRLARRAGSSSAPSTNRLRQTLCRCGILAEPQLSSI